MKEKIRMLNNNKYLTADDVNELATFAKKVDKALSIPCILLFFILQLFITLNVFILFTNIENVSGLLFMTGNTVYTVSLINSLEECYEQANDFMTRAQRESVMSGIIFMDLKG